MEHFNFGFLSLEQLADVRIIIADLLKVVK